MIQFIKSLEYREILGDYEDYEDPTERISRNKNNWGSYRLFACIE